MRHSAFFFPEIGDAGSSLNPCGGSRATNVQLVVSPSRSTPPPDGSIDLVEEGRSVLSEHQMASTPKTGFAPFPPKRRHAAHQPGAVEVSSKPVSRPSRANDASARRIGRSRRGGAIRAVGAPNGVDFGNRFFALPAQTTTRRAPTLRRVTLQKRPALLSPWNLVILTHLPWISGYRTLSI